jgi:hypothetical protein
VRNARAASPPHRHGEQARDERDDEQREGDRIGQPAEQGGHALQHVGEYDEGDEADGEQRQARQLQHARRCGGRSRSLVAA